VSPQAIIGSMIKMFMISMLYDSRNIGAVVRLEVQELDLGFLVFHLREITVVN
jgi:hypothetical protein